MSHQKEFIEKIKDLSGNVLRDAIKSEKENKSLISCVDKQIIRLKKRKKN